MSFKPRTYGSAPNVTILPHFLSICHYLCWLSLFGLKLSWRLSAKLTLTAADSQHIPYLVCTQYSLPKCSGILFVKVLVYVSKGWLGLALSHLLWHCLCAGCHPDFSIDIFPAPKDFSPMADVRQQLWQAKGVGEEKGGQGRVTNTARKNGSSGFGKSSKKSNIPELQNVPNMQPVTAWLHVIFSFSSQRMLASFNEQNGWHSLNDFCVSECCNL